MSPLFRLGSFLKARLCLLHQTNGTSKSVFSFHTAPSSLTESAVSASNSNLIPPCSGDAPTSSVGRHKFTFLFV